MAKIESATRCSQSVLFYFCYALSRSRSFTFPKITYSPWVRLCWCLWMFESCATHSIEPNANWYHLRMYNVLVYLLNATLFPSANGNHNGELLDHGNCLSHSNTISQHILHCTLVRLASSIFQCSNRILNRCWHFIWFAFEKSYVTQAFVCVLCLPLCETK